jgi:hypothetical protein
MKMKAIYLFALIALTLGCWLTARLYWGNVNPSELIVLTIVIWLFASALVLATRRINATVWICSGLLILAILSLPASVLVYIFPARLSQPFASTMAFTLFLILSIALFVAAMLLKSGLHLTTQWQKADAVEDVDSQTQRKHAGRTAVVVLALDVLLLAKVLHYLYWLMVWDTTYDPLKYLWLLFPFLAVLFSAFVLVITSPGWRKLAGGLYVLLIPALIVVSTYAQQVDFRQLTEERAECTRVVIESYYAREGQYPQELRQLTPRYSLSLHGPVIIYGQDWCYDGSDEGYRLGYVYREHPSDPRLVGRIYETVGEMPDRDRICDEEIAALRERYPWMIHSDDYED